MSVDTGQNIPPMEAPRSAGMETQDRKDPLRNDSSEAPVHPKQSGAPLDPSDGSRSPVANRDEEGTRKAGTTPRPTDRPID